MIDFGYSISKTGSLNLDKINEADIKKLEEAVPSFKRCVFCGACTATCSAGSFTTFNIRRIHTMFRRGQHKDLAKDLEKCMLCGKCTLVCPRGVNLRAMVINMRTILLQQSQNK